MRHVRKQNIDAVFTGSIGCFVFLMTQKAACKEIISFSIALAGCGRKSLEVTPTNPVCHLALTSSTTPTAAAQAARACWKGAPSMKLWTPLGVSIAGMEAPPKRRTNILGRNPSLLLTLDPVSIQSEVACWYLHCLLLPIFSFRASPPGLPHQFQFCHLSFCPLGFFTPRMKYRLFL